MKTKQIRGTHNPLSPWELMDHQEVEEIHQLTLRILSEIGVRVDDEEARELLRQAGARVDEDHVAYIEESLVAKALQSVAKETQMYDREGQPAFVLKDDNQVFGGGSDTISTYDRQGRHVDVNLQTVRDFARLQDALPNYDFVMGMGSGMEVEDLFRDGVNFAAMLQNTTKPICFTAQSMGAMEDIVDMCLAVRGSKEALIEKPFTMLYAMPTAPLIHTAEALRGLMLAADYGIPCIYGAAPMKGATGPISMKGSLAVGNAETLSGLVIHQLRRPGAPYVHAMTIGPLQMRTMVNIYNGPESIEIQFAACQMARYYGLPSFVTGGCSDSKMFDVQSASECALSLYTAIAAGGSVVHDVGYLESGLCSSPEQCVLANELIDQLRFLKEGYSKPSMEDLFAEIKEAGIGGNFLMADSTLDQHEQEIWYPDVFDHNNYGEWAARCGISETEVISRRATLLLEEHQPKPLSEELAKRLEQIARHQL
ncbi:MAG: trimethylamine methyltransferase family protein [Eubacteriales bacterium]